MYILNLPGQKIEGAHHNHQQEAHVPREWLFYYDIGSGCLVLQMAAGRQVSSQRLPWRRNARKRVKQAGLPLGCFGLISGIQGAGKCTRVDFVWLAGHSCQLLLQMLGYTSRHQGCQFHSILGKQGKNSWEHLAHASRISPLLVCLGFLHSCLSRERWDKELLKTSCRKFFVALCSP